jgi:hypothetical protein
MICAQEYVIAKAARKLAVEEEKTGMKNSVAPKS